MTGYLSEAGAGFSAGSGKTGALSSWYKSNCTHEGLAQLVLKSGVPKSGKKSELWAGAMKELLDCSGWSLIVSAVGFSGFIKNPITGSDTARSKLSAELFTWDAPPCIGIDWPDRGVPNLGRAWWKSLAAEIKGTDGKVGVCCMGGHGRTGTMLAILVPLLGGLKGKKTCPVKWVRKHYCAEAVESYAQMDYVEYITELAVTAEPSDMLGKGTKASTAEVVVSKGKPPANPTSETILTPGRFQSTSTKTGSESGETDEHEPTNLELLHAWDERGWDEKITAPIEGTSKRWVPVYDEDGSIAGWTEE